MSPRIAGIGMLLGLALNAQGPSRPARSVDALKAFFQANCAKCHGEDGSAVGPDGKRLKGQDFTDPKEMAGKRDEKLARTILRGVFFGKAMPAFQDRLSMAEAQLMVSGVVRKAQKGKAIASGIADPPARHASAGAPRE